MNRPALMHRMDSTRRLTDKQAIAFEQIIATREARGVKVRWVVAGDPLCTIIHAAPPTPGGLEA